MVYLGLLEAPRGVQTVLDGMMIARAQGVAAKLDIIGDGRDRGLLEQQCRELGFTEADVTFHGFLPYDEALRHVQESDVGLVPHLPNDSWNSTIPNKLFDYMSMGMPVISSDARPAARIVTETGAGAVHAGGDAEGFARSMQAVASATRRVEMGLAGRTAVINRYNWSVDGQVVVGALEGLTEGLVRL